VWNGVCSNLASSGELSPASHDHFNHRHQRGPGAEPRYGVWGRSPAVGLPSHPVVLPHPKPPSTAFAEAEEFEKYLQANFMHFL